ncbi:MAG: ABC-F family ATP-binding cassette domain-containing protein [Desulfobacter postgatei]|uniref:ABC-F family ATP-binding cassette domain-containing protein n=1 Tax=Desulfobacter postgatei TaxID=2293 RepID=UPI0023F4488D|nr:ABC-F family ATP-binding cassette domain-containing protein [Desulfobacter postgatei]MDD4273245.1 ABC-F family ATP-binding cassette domain-containing protein [Desulfobacter postgatei]
MLNIESITKGFADHVLLDNTGMQINSGERVGLVGRNGHGKTTLLNIIAGMDHPDDGRIIIPSGYRIGVLSQHIEFSRPTVLGEAMLGLPDHERDHFWKAEKILSGLGFSEQDMQKDPMQFSGGYQVRLNLAKVLVSEPDLLILDEPTNYLDITSIRWITGFLISWPREMLLVTHDRGFMDNVVTHIVGIHRRKMKKIQGDTSKYYLQVAQDEEIYEKTRVNDEKRKKEIELFISRFRAKARLANMVQSRIKTLAKLETKDKLSELKNLDFSFNYLPFAGKQVMTVEDLSFGYEKKRPLIKNFSLTIYPGDRVGVIGKNGKGKTTLLKLISQNMNPDEGWVKLNPGVEIGYFEQTNIQTLNPQFTVEEELLHAYPETDRQTARNICGAMMFEQDAALKKISVLSGGEKARVMLGKLLIRPLNLLLLDEPSNHLDIESSDAFVEALNAFEGAVVLVTHNEMFLYALANRLVIFTADGIDIFEGTYQEFLEKQGWEDEEMIPVKRKKSAQLPKKELRKKKSQALAEKSKQLTPINKKINKIENEIEAKETKMARVNDDLLDASQDQDGLKIATLSKEHAKLESDIETLFDTLAELTERADKIKKKFDQEIFCLESGD